MFVLLPIVFIAGVLTAFTPCALPILPVVLASGLEESKRTLGTIVGLVTIFIIITLSLSTIVQATGISPDAIRQGSMAFLFVFGLLLIFPDYWHKIQIAIEKRWNPPTLGKGRENFVGGLLTGGSLGIVWTPCVGPIVAVVTALTASSPFSLSGILITTFYGLGIGTALWFIAKGSHGAGERLGFFKKKSTELRRGFGVIIALTAVFIYLGGDRALQEWTLEHLPESWTQAGSFLQDNETIQDSINKL